MTIFNIIMFGISAHMFMTYFFPNEYHIALLRTSFCAIVFFSKLEMQLKKIYYNPIFKPVKKYIDNFNKKNEIDIVKFNQVMFSTNRKYISVHKMLIYDFIQFSDYESVTEKSPKINRVLFFGLPKFPLNFDYKLCKFSFMSITVKINNKKYPIKLSNEKENYYIVGNKINLLLIAYLLKSQHNVMCDEVNGMYEMDIIDQDVNMKTFTEKDEIKFDENEYSISPFIYIDTSNMTILDIINKSDNDSDSSYEMPDK